MHAISAPHAEMAPEHQTHPTELVTRRHQTSPAPAPATMSRSPEHRSRPATRAPSTRLRSHTPHRRHSHQPLPLYLIAAHGDTRQTLPQERRLEQPKAPDRTPYMANPSRQIGQIRGVAPSSTPVIAAFPLLFVRLDTKSPRALNTGALDTTALLYLGAREQGRTCTGERAGVPL